MIRLMRLVGLVRIVGRLGRRMSADPDSFIGLFFECVVDGKAFLVVPLRSVEASLSARHRSNVHRHINACSKSKSDKCQLSLVISRSTDARPRSPSPVTSMFTNRVRSLSDWFGLQFVILAYRNTIDGVLEIY